MPQDTFTVEEVNPKHGFARLRPDAGGGLVNTSLYPEPESGEPPFQLRVGDRVRAERRGVSASEVRWVSRAEPPAELVERMGELLAKLEQWELKVPATAYDLAEHHWRVSREDPLRQELLAQLPTFFDWELSHPYEDASLLERLEAAMQPYLPGFGVKPVQGRDVFVVEPEPVEVPAGPGDWDAPATTFEPLLHQVNTRLEGAHAPVRWVPLANDWLLAPPALADLLVLHNVLGPGPA
ncbi:hypothetical protein LZ198_06255 [Myxococcus sp. K15C18031901]|uniref:hypothetical protein n=1 Tax=Myxococcus dinghuensis TaxID=2906761 RepID=UPI0020A7267C|nr:hypothetical protein [Myxococcus dinghuensis]MCP3098478.1 hypothetical protein [Myxococcus dinghuensis]